MDENIPCRRRFLRREAIAINQFHKAIVVHCQVPRTDSNARILPAFRNRLCPDALPASPERVPEFLNSLKLRLFSSANPEATAVKASSFDALRGSLLYAVFAPMMEPVAIQVHLDLFTARRNASGP
jgi:hypothetical protein